MHSIWSLCTQLNNDLHQHGAPWLWLFVSSLELTLLHPAQVSCHGGSKGGWKTRFKSLEDTVSCLALKNRPQKPWKLSFSPRLLLDRQSCAAAIHPDGLVGGG